MEKNRPLIGVGILLFSFEGKLLLCKRRGAHGAGSWGPPGGHLEFGDTPQQTACKELYEEAGVLLTVDEIYFVGFTNDFFKAEQKQYVSLFFKACQAWAGPVINKEPDKISQIEWFDIHELPQELFLPLRNFISCYGITAL